MSSFETYTNGNQRMLYTDSSRAVPKYRGVASRPAKPFRKDKTYYGIGDANATQKQRTRSFQRTLYGGSSQINRLVPNPNKGIPHLNASTLNLRRDDAPIAVSNTRTMTMKEKPPRLTTIKPSNGGALSVSEPTFKDTFSKQGLTQHMINQMKLRALQNPTDPKLIEEVRRVYDAVQDLSIKPPPAPPAPTAPPKQIHSPPIVPERPRPRPRPSPGKAAASSSESLSSKPQERPRLKPVREQQDDEDEFDDAISVAASDLDPNSNRETLQRALGLLDSEQYREAARTPAKRKAFLRRIKTMAKLPPSTKVDKRAIKAVIESKLEEIR